MTLTAAEIAQLVEGTLHGNPETNVCDVSSLKKTRPETITFLADARETHKLAEIQASVVLVPENCDISKVETPASALIQTADPFKCWVALVEKFRSNPESLAAGIDPSAQVDPTAVLGSDVSVGPNAIIGAGCQIGDRCRIHAGVTLGPNVVLGDDVELHPKVVIYGGCVLKNRVGVHANSVIGADGFGYRFEAGQFVKLPHYGRVILEDDVEVGACSTIDRGMIDDTVIGQGSKIDNQVMIAHNCEIGKHNIVVSQVGLAGSVTTGDYCRFGGQVGVADHVHIGEKSSLMARSGVYKDMPAGDTSGGSPALPVDEWKKILMATLKLPELRQTVRQMQKQIARVEKQAASPAAAEEQVSKAA
ncbi:MAG: UDP-3-O-(3-hydroxymyristoyl)glucosamine N-acyltransferase [Rubinisphaera brasiliensis]|uniref:UDP-3-O-(3-hydroxymyristoyl)glucosamine N-acyltransferase n=1 Tax=Rubinisphaera brasiliensis TaxID=119 RepID=UPI00391AF00E